MFNDLFETTATLNAIHANGMVAIAIGLVIDLGGNAFVQVCKANPVAEAMGIVAGKVTRLDARWVTS